MRGRLPVLALAALAMATVVAVRGVEADLLLELPFVAALVLLAAIDLEPSQNSRPLNFARAPLPCCWWWRSSTLPAWAWGTSSSPARWACASGRP